MSDKSSQPDDSGSVASHGSTARQCWTHIGRNQPDCKRKWDCQCARCGSSLDFELCDHCGGDGYYEEDDDEWFGTFYDDCPGCRGKGSFPVCLSSRKYCEANPLEGRESISSGTPEWFTFDPPTD